MTGEIIKEAKKLGLLMILQRIMAGQTITEALKDTGYEERTFRRLLQENEDVAKELLDEQKRIVQGQYNAVVVARQTLINNLIKDAEDASKPTAIKLALEERLSKLQHDLGASLGVGTQAQDDARIYSQGMVLRPGVHKIIQTKTVVEVEVKPDTVVADVVPSINLEEESPTKVQN